MNEIVDEISEAQTKAMLKVTIAVEALSVIEIKERIGGGPLSAPSQCSAVHDLRQSALDRR